ncbi:MAG: ATP-binding protein [Rhizobiaceae bacterium]|nr:MAG: ATP-binding protein [Rhizobiaceae bacterium]
MPFIVLDSVGEFVSLRDATPNGVLIVGGEESEIELSADDMANHLDIIMKTRISVVIDISLLSDDAQAEWVTTLLTAMMKLPPALHQPYLVVIDEVQRFARQSKSSKSRDAIERVAKQGRKRGVTLLVATQRVSDVSKSLTTQTRNHLYGRVTDAVDRKRVREELGLTSAMATSLQHFANGEFLARGPAVGETLRKIRIAEPRSGKLGNDHLIAKLRDPITLLADAVAALRERLMEKTAASHPLGEQPAGDDEAFDRLSNEAAPRGHRDFDLGRQELELLEALAAVGRRGIERASLALMVHSTERRTSFQSALTCLLAAGMAALGAGSRVRISPEGQTVAGNGARIRSVPERLAVLKVAHGRNESRVFACLAAARPGMLDLAAIQDRTGLGPRQAKTALKQLRRDGWLAETRGKVQLSRALLRLMAF